MPLSFLAQVLWKWESDQVEGVVLPPNVRLAKWLPQQDVLGHAATKLFITQGGLLSMHEATFHGVPIVGLPVGSDQLLNMRRAQEAGVGLALIWEELDADKLFTAVRTVLADDTFAANVQDRSKIMRDAEQGPLQRAVFWIEYVLRHGGAEHLKSSAPDLTWYQRNSLDVVAVAATVLAVGLSILLALVYFVVCRCLPSVIRRAVRGRKPKQE
ncbi:unnamed protein product [Notodromas monacha]|uniref:UDP-glucuronosyltransferase n=1 Tax=Notodromas monacha TaxID=399045 RepID=A0A7R9BL08_9CRUS|nr:unnamed protein product [Notodromas monacha]CAG0916121.1 unnamed protein product [Notodromas monacha]